MCANRISHGQMRPVMSIESRQNIAQMKTPPLHRQNTVHPFAIADRILHRAVARRGGVRISYDVLVMPSEFCTAHSATLRSTEFRTAQSHTVRILHGRKYRT